MSKLLIPNTTQVPNVLLEEIMPDLSGSALKVILVILRKTYGFQKRSDKLSFKSLQKLTGLSRDGVNRGIKELGSLISVIRGPKGVWKLEGVNEYSLNLDINTGELVRKSDQSENRTSQKIGPQLVRKSDSSKPNTKHNSAHTKRARSTDPDPRISTLLAAFVEKYFARVGIKYAVVRGKDSALLKSLLAAGHDCPVIQAAMDRYFANEFHGTKGFDIGKFKSNFNALISAGVRRPHNYESEGYPGL